MEFYQLNNESNLHLLLWPLFSLLGCLALLLCVYQLGSSLSLPRSGVQRGTNGATAMGIQVILNLG